MADPQELEALGRQEYLAVTTYKRDGRGVASTVWFVVVGGLVHFRTPADTGKVKRLRANQGVSFCACDRSGRRLGPTYRGAARLLHPPAPDPVPRLLREKYGLVSRLYALTFLLPRRRELFVEITPE